MNPLFVSLDAWNRAQQFVKDAKAAINPADSQALEKLAAEWRMRYEIAQAFYRTEVRP